MDGYRLDLSFPPDWRPLEQLSRLLASRTPPGSIDPDEFIFMGRLVTTIGPDIQLYKHQLTRAYLCLDVLGHCYGVLSGGSPIEVELSDIATATSRTVPTNLDHPEANTNQKRVASRPSMMQDARRGNRARAQ